MRPVVIIGGGISGLATAYYLHKAGVTSTIIEPEQRLGGVLRTEYPEGCIVETGAEAYLSAKPWARELSDEIGIGEALLPSNDERRATWIWKRGRFVRLPDGLMMMVPGKVWPVLTTDLLGPWSKLRGALELFKRPASRHEDRSVSEFIEEHYGQEAVDYIAEPLLAGVYGGDPAQLSARSVLPQIWDWERKYGSLTRGGWREKPRRAGPLFTTWKGGVSQFVSAVADAARPEIIFGKAEKVEKGWRVRVNGDWMSAEQLVIACRAEAVLPGLFPPIPYNSATVVGLVYDKADVAHPLNGFGFLVPKVERRHLSACTWVNTKFEGRAAPGRVVLRLFVTGDPEEARLELREKMGIYADPIWCTTAQWPHAMPQYTVGHSEKVKLIEEMLGDFPGLYVVGNGYQGVGIPDCVRMAKQVADKVTSRVQTP